MHSNVVYIVYIVVIVLSFTDISNGKYFIADSGNVCLLANFDMDIKVIPFDIRYKGDHFVNVNPNSTNKGTSKCEMNEMKSMSSWTFYRPNGKISVAFKVDQDNAVAVHFLYEEQKYPDDKRKLRGSQAFHRMSVTHPLTTLTYGRSYYCGHFIRNIKIDDVIYDEKNLRDNLGQFVVHFKMIQIEIVSLTIAQAKNYDFSKRKMCFLSLILQTKALIIVGIILMIVMIFIMCSCCGPSLSSKRKTKHIIREFQNGNVFNVNFDDNDKRQTCVNGLNGCQIDVGGDKKSAKKSANNKVNVEVELNKTVRF